MPFGILWSGRQDSNLQPTDYKSVALPVVLHQHIGSCGRTRTYDSLINSQVFYRLNYARISIWLREWDLNPRPSAYEADEITDFSIPQYFLKFQLVGRAGLEPAVSIRAGFTVWCDTNYALPTHMATLMGLEPTTSSVTGWRSTLLNYKAI